MSDPSLIYSYGSSELDKLFRDCEVVGDLKDLYIHFDRERVKNHSSIIIKFVISCIVAAFGCRFFSGGDRSLCSFFGNYCNANKFHSYYFIVFFVYLWERD